MTEPRMPTTLPSPVDRGEYRFTAVDAAGTAWRWVDGEAVWAPEREAPERERDGEG